MNGGHSVITIIYELESPEEVYFIHELFRGNLAAFYADTITLQQFTSGRNVYFQVSLPCSVPLILRRPLE